MTDRSQTDTERYSQRHPPAGAAVVRPFYDPVIMGCKGKGTLPLMDIIFEIIAALFGTGAVIGLMLAGVERERHRRMKEPRKPQ